MRGPRGRNVGGGGGCRRARSTIRSTIPGNDPTASSSTTKRPSFAGLQCGRDVLGHVRAAADEERQHQHPPERSREQRVGHRRLVVQKSCQDFAGHPPPPQRLRQRQRRLPARRMPRCPVPHEQQRRRRAIEAVVPEQLAHPPRHQRRQAGMGTHRRRLAQPHLREPPVPGERLRQDHVAVVPRARHHRDDGDLVRRHFVEHGVEPGLALVKRDRDLIEQPVRADRFGEPADGGVGCGIAPGAVRGENECAAAHRATSRGIRSMVGCSRPVTVVRRARTPMSRW